MSALFRIFAENEYMKKSTTRKILIFTLVIVALIIVFFTYNSKNTKTIAHHQFSIDIPTDWRVFKGDNNDSFLLLAYPIDESYFITVIFEPRKDLESFFYYILNKQNDSDNVNYSLPSYSTFKGEDSIECTAEINETTEKIIAFNKGNYSYYISYTPPDKFNERIMNTIKINP